ncbi:general amidase [Diplodia corticola]|uniref:amidase n=1 Tax=Diplodia corticola TaxID=236234 RepID=A0A1J9RVE6_9PEZI|nr:general amidase [Diplodia corticola]OJD31820.1 general amidase [Diplodia corticola]
MVDWRAVAKERRAAQAALIPPELRLKSIPDGLVNAVEFVESCGLLSAEELQLTAMTDARALVEKLASGAISSVRLTTAFIKRTAILQQLIGCCTEIFFDEAIERANKLDTHLAETGKLAGPLHGVPVSVKDGFNVKGVDTAVGWVGLVGKPAAENGPEVDSLLGLGAVIYCKTNIPQSLMMSDSYNHVFGQSVNPFNRTLISGGSSGGEGALVGGRGSVLGMGTDIGGSVRIPAGLQGLYGLSPTIGRVPFLKSARDQEYVVPPVAGPLTHSLPTLEHYLDSLLAARPWETDPRLFPIPWRKELATAPPEGRRLKLAFVFDDGVVKPQPPVTRAIREAADRVRVAGHEVVEWDTKKHEEGVRLWFKAVQADGGKGCRELCSLVGEPLIEGMVVGKESDYLDVAARQQLSLEKLQYERDFLAQWNAAGIDAIVMPLFPWVNYKPKTWVKSKQWLGYSALWNLLNYAALAVPATRVAAELDQPGEEWKNHVPRNESDRFNHEQYDVNLVNGMPVGLQIVTGRFGEEKAVAIAKILESLR